MFYLIAFQNPSLLHMHGTAADFMIGTLVYGFFLLLSVCIGTDQRWFLIVVAVWGYDSDGRQVFEGTLFKNPCFKTG